MTRNRWLLPVLGAGGFLTVLLVLPKHEEGPGSVTRDENPEADGESRGLSPDGVRATASRVREYAAAKTRLVFEIELQETTYAGMREARAYVTESRYHVTSELEPAVESGKGRLRLVALRYPLPESDALRTWKADREGRDLDFDLDSRGRLTNHAFHPDSGLRPRSFVRRLLRLHVPVVHDVGDANEWTWTADPLDHVLGPQRPWVVPGDTVPASGLSPQTGRAAWSEFASPTVPPDRLPVLSVMFMLPIVNGASESLVYSAAFLLGGDGFPLLGVAFGGEIPWRTRDPVTHFEAQGYETEATISRRGFDPPEPLVSLLRTLVHEERDRLLVALPAPNTVTRYDRLAEPPLEFTEEPPPRPLPIELDTDSPNGILAALGWLHEHAGETHDESLRTSQIYLVNEMARRASSDPVLRDRLFSLGTSWEEPRIASLALFVLGMTDRADVRERLLDITESPGAEQTRAVALDSVFKSMKTPPVIFAWRIWAYDAPLSEEGILARVIEFSASGEIPKTVQIQALEGLATSQKAFPPSADNPASRHLRETYHRVADHDLRVQIARYLGEAPTGPNYDFLVRIFLEDPDESSGGIRRTITSWMRAHTVTDPVAARAATAAMLRLAAEPIPIRHKVSLLENVRMPVVDPEAYLRLVRHLVLESEETADPRGDRDRAKILENLELVPFRRDAEFTRGARAILAEAKTRYASRPMYERAIEKASREIDRRTREWSD